MKLIRIILMALLLVGFLEVMPVFAAGCTGGDIVLSEIAYDDVSGDDQEFVELYFPNVVAAGDFDNCVVQSLNQLQAVQQTLDLSTIDDSGFVAGSYYVWGNTGVVNVGTVLPADGLQNGPDDGVALVNTTTNVAAWFYEWENTDGPQTYLSATSVNIGTDTGTTCGTGAETSISQDLTPTVSGTFVSGTCATPGTANQGPTAITLRGLSATSGGTALPVMGLALVGLLVGAVVVRRR